VTELSERSLDAPEPLTAPQEAVAQWLARRRVYIFVMFFFLAGAVAGVQQDPAGAVPFDWAYIALLVAGFGVILIGWRRREPGAAALQQNLLLAMTLMLLLASVPLLVLFPLHTAGGALLFSAMLLLNRLF
jgi:hypothetical protein